MACDHRLVSVLSAASGQRLFHRRRIRLGLEASLARCDFVEMWASGVIG